MKSRIEAHVRGTLQWVLLVIVLPFNLLFHENGTHGRWTIGIGLTIWLLLAGLILWMRSFFIGQYLLSWGPQHGPYCGWFVLVVALLGLLEGIEVLCREYPGDDVLGTSPGEPRLYLWDYWLPEAICGREFAMRILEPAATFCGGLFVAPWDAMLGSYCVVGGLCMFALGNLMFIKEKMETKGLVDARTVGASRIQVMSPETGIREIPSAGEVRIAFARPTIPADSGGLPRAYRKLSEEIKRMLDWKAIEKIYGAHETSKWIRIHCEHCSARIRVGSEHVGRRAKCPRCREVIVVKSTETKGRIL